MSEFPRLGGPSKAIQLHFVERVHTPVELMRLAVQTHLGGLSLSETRLMLQRFGVDRVCSTIHYWVKKSDLEPAGGCQPDQVALDETVINVNGERFGLFGAVDPETGRILHIRLFSHRTIVTTKIFLDELAEKHDVEDAEFLVDRAPWLHAALSNEDLRFDTKRSVIAIRLNGRFKRSKDGQNSFTIRLVTLIRRPSING